jgi:hypothetical protein
LQAITVGFARQIAQSVPQEMYVATLPNRFGQRCWDGFPKTCVVVTHNELHPV